MTTLGLQDSLPILKGLLACLGQSLSCVPLCDPMNCILPGSPVMGSSRQEYYSGLSFPSSGDLPNPGIEPRSPKLQTDSLLPEPPGKPILKGKQS